MKKIIALVVLAFMLVSTTLPTQAYTITEKNCAFLNGRISSVEKSKRFVSVTVKVTEKGKWKNNYYTLKLTKAEYKEWKAEEGKIKKNQKVEIWLYKNHTKSIYDDEFIHIRKGWF